ncbi:MAG: hypothetical protein WBS19_09105 [Candidatus Korobacteraceae bacterium]
MSQRALNATRMGFVLLLLMSFCVALHTSAQAQDASAAASSKPFVVEYYYKVKWGYADEFITLFKKNHYPLLKKQVEMGRMISVSAVVPRYHTTEDGRWDYRVTIVFKNAAVANDASFDEKALIQQMYPDQATYKKEEQRRFEILDAHWDLPIKDLELNSH